MTGQQDRRNDVGQKVFLSILTAVLTTIFLGSLGLGVRNYEINNRQDISIERFNGFMETQVELNRKLTEILEGRAKLPNVRY